MCDPAKEGFSKLWSRTYHIIGLDVLPGSHTTASAKQQFKKHNEFEYKPFANLQHGYEPNIIKKMVTIAHENALLKLLFQNHCIVYTQY